jgi:hypothetical protein
MGKRETADLGDSTGHLLVADIYHGRHMEGVRRGAVTSLLIHQDDLSVKRMLSFLTVMPGEVSSCTGCHEPRTSPPPHASPSALLALRPPPSRIQPVLDTPEIFDYPRDIQPIWDRHCLACRDVDTYAGRAAGLAAGPGRSGGPGTGAGEVAGVARWRTIGKEAAWPPWQVRSDYGGTVKRGGESAAVAKASAGQG